MRRTEFNLVVLAFAVLGGLLTHPSESLAADRLNVLLIAVDDLNNDLGCYGHPQVKSPAIDRLAARGVRFERAYCQFPLCNPSRVSMLSGLRPDTTQVFDLKIPPRTHLKDVIFLPQYFRQQGYQTTQVGKIFHTGEAFEDPPSWDVSIRETGKNPAAESILRSRKHDQPVKYGVEWDVLKLSDAEMPDGVVARRAATMLGEYARTKKPFFLAVGFRRPHQPYAAPQKYFDLYPPDQIHLPSEPAGHLQQVPAAALAFPQGTPPLADADRQAVVAAYQACVTFVDAQIELVLQALTNDRLWDKTVVVLVSDHGYLLGEHGGQWHKMSLFEQSARVPLVIVAPGAAGNGRVCPRTVELLDIYPTLVALCGLPPRGDLQGRDLSPVLKDPTGAWHNGALSQVLRGDTMGRSVRTERYRYTEWTPLGAKSSGALPGPESAELYDHQQDPGEFKNLAGTAELREAQQKLHANLHMGQQVSGM